MNTLLLSAGAVAGANARYWVGVAFLRTIPLTFPWATLTINVTGGLVLGGFIGFIGQRPQDPGWSMLIAVGFCGAYTTFSTFSYETFALLQARELLSALTYTLGSVGLGLAAVTAGYLAGAAMGRA